MLEEDGRYVHSEGDANWWIPSGQVFYSPNEGDSADQEREYAQQHYFLPYRFQDPFEQTWTITYDQDIDGNEYNLLITRSRDPLGNEVNADNDYRVLQPKLLTDPNGNRSAVAFDALGMVVGTAVMGKANENNGEGDSLAGFQSDLSPEQIDNFFDSSHPHHPAITLLGDATSRIIYDLDRFQISREANPGDPTQWEPVFAATLARETHVNDPLPPDGLKIQISFSYSDGFGREIQQKIQAEPGPLNLDDPNSPHTDPRWVGSGWTIFNNKGKPVRQYEPFFDNTHEFKFGKQVGVSHILFYDPLERVIATLHPNHTWEKVVFDPWRQQTWDVNDTVLQADPKEDPDVGDFFHRLDEDDYLPTWYERMISGTSQKQDAAEKAAEHAGTPAIAHLDTLGRPFLTIDDNGTDENGVPQKYETRVILDLEGNQREIIDPRSNTVMQYDYDMLSNTIRQNSMDAGKRWMFGNIVGNIVKQWDERNHEFTLTYDELQRPRKTHLAGGDGAALNHIYEMINYGDWKDMSTDDRNESISKNLIGKPKEQYDTAGRVVFNLYDFKGNLEKTTRRLLLNYKTTPDWEGDDPEALLEQESFNTEIEYDALNRVTQTKTPDGSVTIPSYNDAGLLEKIGVTQDEYTKPFVKNILDVPISLYGIRIREREKFFHTPVWDL
jgi:YD repeat-containing protein